MPPKALVLNDIFHAYLLFVCALALVAFGLALTPRDSIAPTTSEAAVTVKESQTEPEVTQDSSITLLFVGDMMLGRHVETLMHTKGWSYPFEHMTSTLADADAVIGNLEGPIIAGPQTPDGSLVFEFEPDVASALASQHITAVTIDNNHALDQGAAGVESTRTHLAAAGIGVFGDPVEKDGGYLSIQVGKYSVGLVGINLVGVRTVPQKVLDAVSAVRDRNDFVVVSPHWGSEYALSHSSAQEEQADDLIGAGADAIIGHHPHVVQDIQIRDGAPVFYSLGNFVFDQYFSEETEKGLLVRLTLSDDTLSIRLLPYTSTMSQPTPMEADDAAAFLSTLAGRSTGVSDAVRDGLIVLGRPERVMPE